MKRIASPAVAAVLVQAAFMVPFVAVPAAAADTARPTSDPLEAREVRTIWTGPFGVSRPTGLAYDPDHGELLVADAGPAQTSVLRLTPVGEAQGTISLPPVASPATLAFDATTNSLTVLDGPELVTLTMPGRGTRGPPVSRSSALPLRLHEPSAAAFDAAGGRWFVLDGQAITVVDATSAGQPGKVTHISLKDLGAERSGGLAVNPLDGLVYVSSPDQDRLYALDENGRVRKTYGLGQLDLADPGAMTFAPSADTTDDASTMHLFIADAGSSSRLGGVMEVTLAAAPTLAAPTITATLVQTIATSAWSPAAPDPAGVVYLPARDRLEVADSEVDEVTGAGYHGANLWQTTRGGTVTDTGTTYPAFSNEPTGLGYDPGSNSLFISDDTAKRVWVDKAGADLRFGTADDVVTSIDAASYGSGDTEDPAFDTSSGTPTSGHLFFLDGTNKEVYDIDPVNGIFGDGNDVMTHFDVGIFGPTDWEGLAFDVARDTLLVGARGTREIFETTMSGALVRIIDLRGIPAVRMISGLAIAPASSGSGVLNYWVVDRGVDNGADPNENDGRLNEVTIGGTPVNQTPTATNDAYSVSQDTQKVVAAPGVLGNDNDPDGDPMTAVLGSNVSHGTLVLASNGGFTYTPAGGYTGPDSFTYTAHDASHTSNTATVSLTVSASAGISRVATSTAGQATTTTLTLARPAGTTAGDLMLATLLAGGATTITPPAGWAPVVTTASGSAITQSAFSRVAGATEPASSTWTIGTAYHLIGAIATYRGATAIDVAGGQGNTSSTSIAAPSVTTTEGGTRLVGVFGTASATTISPDLAMDEFVEVPAPGTGKPTLELADEALGGSGPTGTRTAVAGTAARTIGQLIALRSTPGANQAPTAVGESYPATEDATLQVVAPGVLGNDSDPESGALTAVLVTAPTHGALTLAGTGSFTYVPVGDYNGPDSFTYQARDPSFALSNTVTVSITVAPVSDPPVVTNPGDRSNAEGANVSLQIVAVDADGDALGFSAQGLPPGLTIGPTTGLISGTIAAGAAAGSPYAVSVTADDAKGGSDTEAFAWTVSSPGGPPSDPTGLGASLTAVSIDLDWTDNPEVGVAGYNVYRAASPGGTYTRLNGAPVTPSAYSDLSAALGQPYDYRVTAVDTSDVESGPASTTASRRIGFIAATGAVRKKSTSLTISVPAGTAVGDMMLAGVLVKGIVVVTPPAGWSQILSTPSGSAAMQVIFSRVADGTESPDYTWTISASKHMAGSIASYRGATAVGALGGQGNSSSTSIRAPSVTAVAGGLLAGFFGTSADATIAPDPAMREVIEVRGASTAPLALELADDVADAAGASGIRTALASAAARNIGQVVLLLP